MFLLDASALTAVFVDDAHSPAMARWMSQGHTSVVSDFAAAEFAAVVSRLLRMNQISERTVDETYAEFDQWRRAKSSNRNLSHGDVVSAEGMVRQVTSKLAASDALYVAMAAADRLTLVTFDRRQATAAKMLGVACVVPA